MHDLPEGSDLERHLRRPPTWLVPAPYEDVDLGVLRTGKEAQINLIERSPATDAPSRTTPPILLAQKRYMPRHVKNKGELEAMGVQKASTFRNDAAYREGRQFRKTRDRRAVERMSAHGKRLLQARWTGHEHDVMAELWAKGLRTPYPVSYGDDVFLMEYIGDRNGAAPHLARARLDRRQLRSAYDQLVEGLYVMTSAGWVHGDLSAFNLLWWDDTLWFIDLPQAMELASNPQGLNFVHRDVMNVCTWFGQRGLDVDGETLFAELLTVV